MRTGRSVLVLLGHGHWAKAIASIPAYVLELAVQLSGLSIFFCSLIDCWQDSNLARERLELEHGYSGHVRNSKASIQQDKLMILTEIRANDEEESVDTTIDVLLRSGMATSSLRTAHERGVDIGGVGITRWKFLATSWWLFLSDMTTEYVRRGWKTKTFWVALCSYALWLILFVCRFHRRDQRAFSAIVAWKFLGVPCLVCWTVYMSLES